ncbi:Hydroxymethylglutaryl-CoA lyase [Rubellimicrobium mesophilum DSM 19309]|uniref:Hydroxymethylglutaryl-CoA lyase n=1 Tax=Rubellimicrobium mesophilum DSM 19309 TaxID=442562 RepID=A0A017HL18_9RHOB|nr:hydroxymethylglutaryl-CoA lyase [Rubellimicrobium mesophilum]EYD74873.1 Hydroxymethylglutaryl-CoA lyase [Rubellimicrobium mesophilum DSM 19309]
MAEAVEIVEVGPRDGLQNQARIIPTDRKVALVDALSEAGFQRIEVASFVSPRWVPQMADGAEVLVGIGRRPGTRYMALAPNLKGYEAARADGADEVAVVTAASEGFARANLNATVAETLDRIATILDMAHRDEMPVRGYVSVVTDCPYDGEVAPASVARVSAALRDLGCHEVSLGETLGRGTPERVDAMLRAVLEELPPERLAGHFHDTSGRALENVEVALGHGLRVFDSSVGGLGGCPFAPGAAGNVATEALAERLATLGYETALDREALARATALARSLREG